MGLTYTKFQTSDKLLHYYNFGENKLYVFLPTTKEFFCFSIFYTSKKKFIFYADSSISLPNGIIYLIGGERLSNPEEINKISKAISPTDNVMKIDLNNHKNFSIDLRENEEKILLKNLPQPRNFHGMVYILPYIYVIGGLVDNISTRKCYKYHTSDDKWEEINELSADVCNLGEPGMININNEYIYVFDSVAKEQTIHKYSVKNDKWNILPYRTNGFTVIRSVSSNIFQISNQTLLIVNGMVKDDANEGYYYFYDFISDKFILQKKHSVLNNWLHDRQGVKDYSNKIVYCMLNEKKTKAFDFNSMEWYDYELTLRQIPVQEQYPCCGR